MGRLVMVVLLLLLLLLLNPRLRGCRPSRNHGDRSRGTISTRHKSREGRPADRSEICTMPRRALKRQ